MRSPPSLRPPTTGPLRPHGPAPLPGHAWRAGSGWVGRPPGAAPRVPAHGAGTGARRRGARRPSLGRGRGGSGSCRRTRRRAGRPPVQRRAHRRPGRDRVAASCATSAGSMTDPSTEATMSTSSPGAASRAIRAPSTSATEAGTTSSGDSADSAAKARVSCSRNGLPPVRSRSARASTSSPAPAASAWTSESSQSIELQPDRTQPRHPGQACRETARSPGPGGDENEQPALRQVGR